MTASVYGTSYAGILVGYTASGNTLTITNSNCSGSSIVGLQYVGFIGYQASATSVTNLTLNVTVFASSSYVGLFIGYAMGSVYV